MHEDLSAFPGGDIVAKGLADLTEGSCTEEALLVLIAGPRLASLGFTIPVPSNVVPPYEDALYDAIETRLPNGAHSAYNALIARVVSFAQTYKA